MSRFTPFRSRVVPLLVDDVDTDQIIPARFLKVTTKDGLGSALFADWRQRPGFPIGAKEHDGARVLLAGCNFGCGSSREHAPWALVAGGFSAVIAKSFADIFRGNALKNGLLPIALGESDHARLVADLTADPRAEVAVDLASETVTLPDGAAARFAVDPFSRDCLLEGVDELGYLLSHDAAIASFEAARGAFDGPQERA